MTGVEKIAEKFRREPYHMLPMKYNCAGKSFRFKKECLRARIKARVVISFGIVETRRFGPLIMVPMIHGWSEVDNRRIEVARPLDEKSPWGTFDIDLKPIVAIWI